MTLGILKLKSNLLYVNFVCVWKKKRLIIFSPFQDSLVHIQHVGGDIHMRSAHSEANLPNKYWGHGVKRGTIVVCYLFIGDGGDEPN